MLFKNITDRQTAEVVIPHLWPNFIAIYRFSRNHWKQVRPNWKYL